MSAQIITALRVRAAELEQDRVSGPDPTSELTYAEQGQAVAIGTAIRKTIAHEFRALANVAEGFQPE